MSIIDDLRGNEWFTLCRSHILHPLHETLGTPGNDNLDPEMRNAGEIRAYRRVWIV